LNILNKDCSSIWVLGEDINTYIAIIPFDFRWLLPPENGGSHHVKSPTRPGSNLIFGGRRAARQHPVFKG
jgi:hypothetical protein